MGNAFLKNLTAALEKMLAGVLAGESYSLFRRSPQVVTGVAFSPTSPDYHLYFRGHEFVSREAGSFRCDDGQGAALVLRLPSQVKVHYSLLVSQSAVAARLDAWDRLMAHFFDHPSMDPVVPESLKAIPGLYDRMASERATLSMSVDVSSPNRALGQDPLQISLQYSALYHSGVVLSREALVKQRVIEYRNRERSTP